MLKEKKQVGKVPHGISEQETLELKHLICKSFKKNSVFHISDMCKAKKT